MVQDERTKVTVEIQSDSATYKIEGNDLRTLEAGLKLVQEFQRKASAKLAKMSGSRSRKSLSSQADTSAQLESRLPEWFAKSKPTVGEVIALVLYHSNGPMTNIEITKIVGKQWRSVHLKNISKHLTTKNKFLYPYVTKDAKTKAFSLNGNGKNWVSSVVIPRLMKSAGIFAQ